MENLADTYKTRMAVFAVLALLLFSPIIYFSFPGMFKTQVQLRENTPVFTKPFMGAPLLGLSGQSASFAVSGMKNFYFEKNPYGAKWYPIMEYTTFYKIQIAGKEGWVSPDFFFIPGQNNISMDHISRNNYIWGVLFSLCGLIFLLLYAGKDLFCDMLKGKAPALNSFGIILFFLYLRNFLLFLYLYFSDNMVVVPTDEHYYFLIGKDILNGVWNNKWAYTVGFPLLHIPFIAAFRPADYFDIYDTLRFWNAFLIAPLCLALLFLIIRKLSGSAFKALITVLVLIIVPFFYYPYEVWIPPYFRAFFIGPGWDISSFRPYYLFFWTGLNAMSDMCACLAVFLCIYLGLIMPRKMYSLVLISSIFGFACLLRLNNIYFAPLIAYLFYLKFKQELLNPTYIVKAFLTAMIFFLAVFGWQFIVNFLHFDSALIWPYSLHKGAEKGFELTMLLNGGMDFLLQTNLIYMTAGILGMFFIRNVVRRNIFVLWALPLIVFFCGYVCVSASPIRFILPAYGALAAAFILLEFMKEHPWKLIAFMLAVIILNFILLSPPFKYLVSPYPLQPLNLGRSPAGFYVQVTLTVAVPLISIISSAILLRKEKNLLLFMACFFLLYYSGSGTVLFTLMLILLLITFLSIARDIFFTFSRKNKTAENVHFQ